MPQEQQNQTDINNPNLSGDELDQVRELLFGGTIREIERQREALQKDVNVSFEEADQMTNRRLDDVMRRFDGLHQEVARAKEEQNKFGSIETQRIESTLVKLASEQSSSLAKETQRIDHHIALETERLDDHISFETHRIDEAIKNESLRIDEMIAIETGRINEALATERARIDNVLSALNKQMDTDKVQYVESMRLSLANERKRVSQNMRLLADNLLKDPE